MISDLIDAICDNFMVAFPGRPWHPSYDSSLKLTTFCNLFVNGVARSLGYMAFWPSSAKDPLTANQIHDFISNSTEWMSVSWDVAQAHANDGSLVIASQKEDGAHGHVCIIRPGKPIPSGHFGHPAPRCANVGSKVFMDGSVAYAFQKEPSYFCLISTIKE